MFISQELRKKNIAEYLLYMWQVEDLIRAYGCSLSAIRHDYIDKFNYDEEQKEEMTDWYGNLVRMMNQEGCRQKGHLQINKIVMQQLIELNARSCCKAQNSRSILRSIIKSCRLLLSCARGEQTTRRMKLKPALMPFMA